MSASIEPRIMRVGDTISSTPRCLKRPSFLGLLTRAIVRGTLKWCLAIWQMTRLSSSSPVTAATMSALFAPAWPRYLPSEPSWEITIDPISSVICAARARSRSIKATSWPDPTSSRARKYPTLPPPTTMTNTSTSYPYQPRGRRRPSRPARAISASLVVAALRPAAPAAPPASGAPPAGEAGLSMVTADGWGCSWPGVRGMSMPGPVCIGRSRNLEIVSTMMLVRHSVTTPSSA